MNRRTKDWLFTINNPTEADLPVYLAEDMNYLVYQRERGEDGTEHYQGFIQFKSSKVLRTVKRVSFLTRSHLEPRRGTSLEASNYCQKTDTRIDGPYVYGELVSQGQRTDLTSMKKLIDEGATLEEVADESFSNFLRYSKGIREYMRLKRPRILVETYPLYDWQAGLYDDLRIEADSRKIVFVVDTRGGKGKSWFCRYVSQMLDKVQVLYPTKKADMAYALREELRILFVDCSRSFSDFLDYDFLEQAKNRMVFSGKYESSMKYFSDYIHVVVMMNQQPDLSKLSRDRYKIINI